MEQDPEIAALAQITTTMALLDEEARRRVLRWMTSKYGQPSQPTDPLREIMPVVSEGHAASTSPESLDELYIAADPRTDAEKVLVVGYWFQHVEGMADLDAQRINSELKHLGYGIGNITRAFSHLMRKRPQLAIQIRKSGTTKQARKRFRITSEGIRAVQRMVGGQRIDD